MALHTVNAKQWAVLTWIADGCPAGVMTDDSYKTSAVALKSRRLVTITKKRSSWTANVTEAGRFFIEHGHYPEGHWPDTPKGSALYRARPQRPVTALPPAEQLVADVQAAGGRLTVEGGSYEYAQLISNAMRFGKVPPGFTLRWEKGPSWSEGVVVLAPLPDWVPRAPGPVTVPAAPRSPHPAVQAIKDNAHLLPWRKTTRSRALRLLHALATEAEHRGYAVHATTAQDRTGQGLLSIEIHTHRLALTMRELDDRTPHVPTAKEIRDHERYSWNRIPTYDYTPSGRLQIEVLTGSTCQQDKFADSKRHSLDDRLGHALFEMELRAALIEEARLAREAAEAERQHRWQAAYDQAVEHARHDHRLKELEHQEAAWRWHQRMTTYLDAMTDHISLLEGEARQHALEWHDWASQALRTHHPFARGLRVPDDPEFSSAQLEPYMRGYPPHKPPH